jgi:HK97 gp10 family phage protein
MASENFNIQGLKELHQMLQELPVRIEKNIMRGAIRAGANVYRDAARLAAPVDDGTLKKSIKTGSTNIKKGNVVVTVGTDLYYARMVEFGTASYYTGKGRTVGKPYKIPKASKSGKISKRKKKAVKFGNVIVNNVTHPGIKPQPFMRRAFDGASDQAVSTFAQYVSTRLAKEIGKI